MIQLPSPEAIPVSVEAEISENYEDEERKQLRSGRTAEHRLEKLETKTDQIVDRLGKVEITVADFGGQMKILPKLVEAMENATVALQQRDHVTFTAKVDVDKAQAIGEVEVQKTKWQMLLKVAAAVGAIVTTVATTLMAKGCH